MQSKDAFSTGGIFHTKDYIQENMNYLFTLVLSTLLSLNNNIHGCSPNGRPNSDPIERARSAKIIVFATVIQSPYERKSVEEGLYTAKLHVHCVFKGAPLPKYISVDNFGSAGGLCTNTRALLFRTYILFITNTTNAKAPGKYVVDEINLESASVPARRRLVRKLLREYGEIARRPFINLSSSEKNTKCSLKRMKTLIRRSKEKVRRILRRSRHTSRSILSGRKKYIRPPENNNVENITDSVVNDLNKNNSIDQTFNHRTFTTLRTVRHKEKLTTNIFDYWDEKDHNRSNSAIRSKAGFAIPHILCWIVLALLVCK